MRQNRTNAPPRLNRILIPVASHQRSLPLKVKSASNLTFIPLSVKHNLSRGGKWELLKFLTEITQATGARYKIRRPISPFLFLFGEWNDERLPRDKEINFYSRRKGYCLKGHYSKCLLLFLKRKLRGS